MLKCLLVGPTWFFTEFVWVFLGLIGFNWDVLD